MFPQKFHSCILKIHQLDIKFLIDMKFYQLHVKFSIDMIFFKSLEFEIKICDVSGGVRYDQLPLALCENVCSDAQSQWWSAAYKLFMNTARSVSFIDKFCSGYRSITFT